ncbi:alpha,alpha-trehalase [Simiduia litorea]|uniref:alpha,alpha-trehalase TreF n=1 Tax=Simiduia litorea TaxID=1435348 RepID=UPI0036F1A1BE
MTINIAPDKLFLTLFEHVQEQQIFPDSKTFVDAVPKCEPRIILADYQQQKSKRSFNLLAFVQKYFDLPESNDETLAPMSSQPLADETVMREHIGKMWSRLKRQPEPKRAFDSLIDLPYEYIVPGGRFREIYYWDSYFTLLGLAASGETATIRAMVDNFAYLIDELGFVPNGNRSYYCSRSQPPLFALMVELLVDTEKDKSLWLKYLPALMREYGYWMDGGDSLQHGGSYRRVVNYRGCLLNRYWDDLAIPRQESYHEDTLLAQHADQPADQLYRNIRAACETGWDFSSRWLLRDNDLTSLRTTDVIPIDLNCIFIRVEEIIAKAWAQAGDMKKVDFFTGRAQARALVIQQTFYDEAVGEFVDVLLPNFTTSERGSIATAWPLFVGVATDAQASRVARRLDTHYLAAGGWLTTSRTSGQQWDAPNGWAPLQWIAYQGLLRYGFVRIANTGARRWIDNNMACFKSTGMLFEKYDVQRLGKQAEGGEYPVQSGFGWTNAILLCLMDGLSASDEAAQ